MRNNKDLNYLLSYKEKVFKYLIDELNITKDEANNLFRHFESIDLFRLDAPELPERAIGLLIPNNGTGDPLSMVSRKPGNIIIHFHQNWESAAGSFISSATGIAGLSTTNPVVVILSFLGALLTVSSLSKFKLDKNKTAIIMALQGYHEYRAYAAPEELCRRDANRILAKYQYDKMSVEKFSKEVDNLLEYGCIERQNGMIKLKEKLLSAF